MAFYRKVISLFFWSQLSKKHLMLSLKNIDKKKGRATQRSVRDSYPVAMRVVTMSKGIPPLDMRRRSLQIGFPQPTFLC